MTVFAAPIELVQAALHRIGEDEIVSLDEGSTNAAVFLTNYEGIVRAQLSRHAWTFAKRTLDTTYQGSVTLGGWTHAHVLPVEALVVRYVMLNGVNLRSGDYAIEGNRLLTRTSEQLQVVATTRVPEGEWPGDFAEAIVQRLQGLGLEALCDKPQDGRLKIRDAEAMMRDVIVRDKRQEPGVAVNNSPLAEAWRGGGRRGWSGRGG